MLADLARNGHHTPFEKSILHFTITCDVATHIHYLKHRIGVSINAESARYKQIKEDRYYVPMDWPEEWRQKLAVFSEEGLLLYHQCLESLTTQYGMTRKRAKETARYFRPYNTQIQSDVAFNFRSFMHFLGLRHDAHAQDEIHSLAHRAVELVSGIPGQPFLHSLTAFGYPKPFLPFPTAPEVDPRDVLLEQARQVLSWYAGHLRPEDRVNDNGDKATELLRRLP